VSSRYSTILSVTSTSNFKDVTFSVQQK
jgi:hypothetical protein